MSTQPNVVKLQDVLRNAGQIRRDFGWRCLVAAVVLGSYSALGRRTGARQWTFLEVVWRWGR